MIAKMPKTWTRRQRLAWIFIGTIPDAKPLPRRRSHGSASDDFLSVVFGLGFVVFLLWAFIHLVVFLI